MKKEYDKNEFGGGNRNSLYVPMSEVEQEALARLVDAGDLCVHIVDWGMVENPKVTFGDARILLAFRVDFTRPEVPQDVHYFDMELRTGAGLLLFGPDRLPTEYGGKPIGIAAGMFIDMEWHIQIKSMDPKLVKALTGARGLTSRLQDRDTGEMTETGNMGLNSKQKGRIHMLREGEKFAQADTHRRSAEATYNHDDKQKR
jgi:hypothetical protein